MKKCVKFLLVFIFILTFSGCKSSLSITNCKLRIDQSKNNYVSDFKYVIYSRDGIVEKVETTETITSKNNTIRSYFEKQLNSQYKLNNKKYSGYSYKITNKDGKVVSKVTIDYTKVNMKKFIKDNPAMKEFVNKNNKPTLKGIKKMYKSSGATCEK